MDKEAHRVRHQFARDLRRNATPAEQALWQYLSRKQIMGLKFRRQHVIDPYIVDFYCHEKRLVIEVDGGSHLEQVEYDRQRENYLAMRGLRIMRFTNQQIKENLSEVIEEIAHACRV